MSPYENFKKLPLDKNVHLMGGEYLEKYEPELSASGMNRAPKYARGNTPTTSMSSARDMDLAHIYRQAATPMHTAAREFPRVS